MRCMPSFSKNLFLASKNNDDTKTILACSFVTHLHSWAIMYYFYISKNEVTK